MIAYHLDRTQNLKENSMLSLLKTNADPNDPTIKLYGLDVVSYWGKCIYECLLMPYGTDIHTIDSLQIDLVAESLRKSFYPNKPSRFKSIFAVKELADFKLWREYLPISQDSHIYEIEYDPANCIELDAYFLKGGIDCNPFAVMESLQNYWSGQISDSPLPELLIPLPVFIGRRLSSDEIIF